VGGRLGSLGWVRFGRGGRVWVGTGVWGGFALVGRLGSQAYGLVRVLGRRLRFSVRSLVNKDWPGPAVCIFC
jgi:hypothetical protein